MPHPAHKVSIGGGDTFLSRSEDTHIASQTGAAGRGGNDGTGLYKGLYKPLLKGLKIYLLCRGNDNAANPVRNLLSL